MAREYRKAHWYGHHVRFTSYEAVKRSYELTKPLQGFGRKEHGIDIRPLTVRHRKWEAWHHDPETNAYGMAFVQAYPQNVDKDKVTGKLTYGGYTENRKPLLMIYPNGDIKLDGHWFNSYTTWEMLSAMLPEGITFVKYGAKCYFKLDQPEGEPMYFFFPHTNMTFIPYESNGKRYYRVAAPMQEVKYVIDRDKAKRARAEVAEFLKYYALMVDMLEQPESVGWKEKRECEEMLEEGTWLWRKSGEEYGEKWPDAVSALYRSHIERRGRWKNGDYSNNEWEHYTYYPDIHDIERELRGERLYRMVRPYTQELVPLGKPFYSNGRG